MFYFFAGGFTLFFSFKKVSLNIFSLKIVLQNLTINKPIDIYKNIQTTNQNETNMFFYIYL
jgi:hypothetical protein